MIIRHIETTDITKFEAIETEDGNKPTLNLSRWLEAERTKLEWCFVAEESGKFLARVIYGVFEEQPHDLKIWQLKTDNKVPDFLEVGKALIRNSLAQLKEEGFKTAEYHLYSSPENDFKADQSIFIEQGFLLTQEKKSFEAIQLNALDQKQRLTYKTIEETGKEVFINAIEQVTQSTLDREDLDTISTHGSLKAAIMYYEILEEIDYNASWWRLGYLDDGTFVGLVIPQRFSEEAGAINYIGVVPQKRGAGYVQDLLEEGSRLMLEAGISILIADIDVQNYPLENALKRLGYIEKRSLAVLKLEI